MNEVIISHALSRLNDTNNGDSIFEKFCQALSAIIDPKFHCSSGLDAGGDGGIDGWSYYDRDEKFKMKYAFSINKQVKTKIQKEINKTDISCYKKMRYFTNQPLPQKEKEEYRKENNFKGLYIEIFDLDNLIEHVSDHEELGKYIDLPDIQASITIDYLKKHNQLHDCKDEITNYIPRTMLYWDKDQNKRIDKSPSEYINNLPSFTLLQAPAGYGKTCFLQQVHQQILNEEINATLPPVFIQLSSYGPTSPLSNTIKDKMVENADYRANDFLLLLDGYDEVKEKERETLLKEIQSIIKHSSFIRKVIMSVREHTFNFSDFKKFDDCKIVSLDKPDDDNIRKLFLNQSISPSNQNKLLNNSFFKNFLHNVFYIVKLIDYYKKNNTIAENVIELYEFIVEQEVSRLFRKNTPAIENLKSLALYMTLNQTLKIDKNDASQFSLNLSTEQFSFSHKSIQEYLAAQKIVAQPLEQMKKILAKGDRIIPYLTNTFGFVLNILNTTDSRQDIFKALVNWALEDDGNAPRLLQIEANKISPEMNHQIFSAVLEVKINNFSNQSDLLLSFGLKQDESRKKNIPYLVQKIKALKDTHYYHYYTGVLQDIIRHYIEYFDECYQEEILNFLFQLLEPENINDNEDFIDYLLYSVAFFPVIKELEDEKIVSLVNQSLSIKNSEKIVNIIAELLLTSEKSIDQNVYWQIYKILLIKQKIKGGRLMAHSIPYQINDNDYHEPMSFWYWDKFIPLTKKFFENNRSSVWKLMKYAFKNHRETTLHTSDLYKLFKIYFAALSKELEKELETQPNIAEDKEKLIVEWIAHENLIHASSGLLDFLLAKCENTIFLMDIMKKIIIQDSNLVYLFFSNIINLFLNRLIRTTNDFDFFKRNFYVKNKLSNSFFESFCHHIKKDHPIYDYVFKKIPSTLKESIQKSQAKPKETALQSQQREPSRDYCIAFDNKALNKEVKSIFDYFGCEKISKDIFWDRHNQRDLQEKNDFARYLFESSYQADQEIVDKKQMMENLAAESWKKNFMLLLSQYCSKKNININNFTKEQKIKIKEWIKYVLDTYPLTTIESPLKYSHITLSYILRYSNFLKNDADFKDNYQKKMLGLSFAGFANVLYGIVMVDDKSYSIDYLDQYFSPLEVITFINENFHHAFSNSNNKKTISVCGYLDGHIDKVFPFQKDKMKPIITEHIKNHLKESYYPNVTECAFALGFSITDLEPEDLSKAFILDEKEQDLAHNFAYSFIRPYTHTNTIPELKHLLKALQLAFNNSTNNFHKKIIAEYHILQNFMSGGIFEFYANYLMENDNHTISSKLMDNLTLKTADIQHLKIVEKLFRYARQKEKSERREIILEMAISSYKAMAGRVSEQNKLDQIINSMEELAQEGNHFLHQQIQEIKNEFSQRTYQPLSEKEVIQLKKESDTSDEVIFL